MTHPSAPSVATPTATVTHVREHERRVSDCTACGLHATRSRAVTGQGPADARLVLVGVAPRRQEDLQGVAFAGAARNVLDNALLAADLDPGEVRITSLIRCRPPDDRLPTRAEVASCAPHLDTELHLVGAEVVVAFGAVTTEALYGRTLPIDRVAGYRLHLREGVTLIPTYHPVDAVRGVPQAGTALRRDLMTAKAVLDGKLRTGAEVLHDLRSKASVGG